MDLDPRRKRALFRANHRGMNENDILLGGFVKARIADLDPAELDQLEALMEENDNDLYLWIIGERPVPEAFDTSLMRKIKEFNNYIDK
ncbi:MAG: succinate dehydrogenase assembly factor 2 [Rhodospirillales bacterium]|nr:succinate dehydrogenase assembly factor 2 [Rhodospirillales bacterium]MCC7167488.1 succinate dehydrogenase assembly factor 2 [Rhodospirillales bacterium]